MDTKLNDTPEAQAFWAKQQAYWASCRAIDAGRALQDDEPLEDDDEPDAFDAARMVRERREARAVECREVAR